MTLDAVFRPPIRIAFVTLTAVGAVLACVSAVVGALRLGGLSSLALMGPAVALAILAIAISKGARWARVVSLVATATQPFAILALAWELSQGMTPPKANELVRLGLHPYLGLWVNMAYSSAAFAIFIWAIVPFRRFDVGGAED